MIKDSGERVQFETGAVRDMHGGKGRMDLLPWYGIIEVSKHCEDGALKYGEHNVDKGIPLHSLLDSAARHLAKHIAGMTDEPHLRAAAWNILWALNQETTHPELDDMPKKVGLADIESVFNNKEKTVLYANDKPWIEAYKIHDPDNFERVIRCRDCVRRGTNFCPMHINGMEPDEELLKSLDDDYCSYGERMEHSDEP